MKNRNLEALTVLSLVNDSSKEGCFVDNLMDLEDLVEAKKSAHSNVLREFFKLKYILRCGTNYKIQIGGISICSLIVRKMLHNHNCCAN